ncbi:MAG: cytochrome c [Bacteroidota bacterium]|nr:cytochrome c [Bacteroidota bacterium]
MYSIIYNTHKISVMLFLFLYVVKTFLLLTNNNELLEKVKKVTRIPEMVISLLFLGTGLYMVVQYPMMGIIYYIKLFCVFLSIPLAIVGFKKNNKIMAAGAVCLLFAAYGLAEVNKNSLNRNFTVNPSELAENADVMAKGKLVYDKSCAVCHGANGDAGIAGSADLSKSNLSKEEKLNIIKNGKNSMPKFNKMPEDQLNAVVEYIEGMKK